jgi:hypothetical protein
MFERSQECKRTKEMLEQQQFVEQKAASFAQPAAVLSTTHSNFSFKLSTAVRSLNKADATVYIQGRLHSEYRKAEKGGWVNYGSIYVAELYTVEGNQKIGYMRFKLVTHADELYHISLAKVVPFICIEQMETWDKGISQVGTALHECAFRISLLWGCEGRVNLEAVRESHYFHYKNGFRKLTNFRYPDRYYMLLARALIKADGKRIVDNLGSANLFLPRKSIENNIQKWNIEFTLSANVIESENTLSDIHESEIIIEEALKNSLSIQVLLAMEKGYGYRFDEPSYDSFNWKSTWKKKTDYESKNPSLVCEVTTDILSIAKKLILKEMVLNDHQKEANIAVIVAGAMILMMAIQDEQYGPQPRYACQLLYSHATFNSLYQPNIKVHEAIKMVGERALLKKEIIFDVTMYEKFFPHLCAVSGLKAMFCASISPAINKILSI